MKDTRHGSAKKALLLWPFLAVSATLNLAGAAWGLGLLSYFQETHQSMALPLSAVEVAAATSMSAATQPAPVPPSKTATASQLHWRDLESENYDTFIARLRDIGCPESTIKDILTGELKTASASKRAELEQKILRSSNWSPPRGVSRHEYLAAQLRKLDREIETRASDLLRTAPGLSTQQAAAAASEPSGASNPPVRYPVAMEDVTFQAPSATGNEARPPGSSNTLNYVAPGVVEASPETIASIQQLQNEFVQDIGGPHQDVEDPQYEQVWRDAQFKADQIFRARHGWNAYNDIALAAAQKAYEEKRKAAGK